MIPNIVWRYAEKIESVSRYTHDLVFSDHSQSWSSRSYWKKDKNIVYKIMVFLIGEDHCRECYLYWHKEKEEENRHE